MNEILDTLQRAAWRALDAFIAALVADNLLGMGLPEWKIAAVAAVSAGLKPITAFVQRKAGRS